MVRLKWPQFSLHKTWFSPCYRPKYIRMELNFILPKRSKSAKTHIWNNANGLAVWQRVHMKIIRKSQKSCKSLWSSRKWQNRLNICHFQLCACQLNRLKDFVMLFPFSEHKPYVNSMRLYVKCSLGVAKTVQSDTVASYNRVWNF